MLLFIFFGLQTRKFEITTSKSTRARCGNAGQL